MSGESKLSEELTSKSATGLAALVRSRAVSPVEVVTAHLARIQQTNPALNAIVTLAADALDRARAAEAAIMNGAEIGPLHGVPLTVKDTLLTVGLRTTSGSRLFHEQVPDRDATAVARLKAAGAIILGKTNTPEMAIPYETDNLIFGRTNNPHDLNYTPGGSSGGEAAAIAAGLSPAGIGSDLSGSIRVPAHFCGIVGLKPTAGRISMAGHMPVATGPLALGACVGPMARSVDDLALLLSVLAEPTQFEINSGTAVDLSGLSLAWYTNDGVSLIDADTTQGVEAAAKALSDAGLNVSEARPPGVAEGSRLWIELFARAAAEQTRELYRGREAEAGAQVLALLRTMNQKAETEGKVNEAERLASALLQRERLREELLSWMKTTPLILAPVGATAAFKHGAARIDVGEESVSVFRAFSYARTFNVFGLPAAVVPISRTAAGLPIGVQIVGRPFEERMVLAVAALLERRFGGWQRPRPYFA